MAASHKPLFPVAMLLLWIAIAMTAQAQSALHVLQPPSKAVVAVGMVEPDLNSSSAARAERFASITGSGFFVSKQGYVITAGHVVRAAERAREQMQGTDKWLFVGLPSSRSFIPVPAAAVNIVTLCSARPADGTLIEAAGLPTLTGLAPVYNTGHLTNTVLLRTGDRSVIVESSAQIDVARLAEVREFYLADSKTDEGMSGGPAYLVDSGAVIGVVQGYTQDPRLAVFVPARYVIELLKRHNIDYEEFPADKSD
jgi:hypothetical protein